MRPLRPRNFKEQALSRMLSLFLFLAVLVAATALADNWPVKEIPVGEGYCRTSVNAAVFRGASVVSNDSLQYVSYYDPDGHVVLGRRRLDSDDWTLYRTRLTGNVKDAHNVISIGLDGDGLLHISFDHHGDRLRYCRVEDSSTLEPGELLPMLSRDEESVTYPEFHTLPDGDLLFAYREGESGNGNLILNRYDVREKKWRRVLDRVIDGEGKRNAYWQMFVDKEGVIYLSWVWRESWLVETNHDLCYAVSRDGGLTWENSKGEKYALPVTTENAEIAWHIPQSSELINQTGMSADSKGNPYIATYWRDANDSVPQYRIVWHDGKEWQMSTVGKRSMPFSLSGGGTKMIPISRPKIVSDGEKAYFIFRDEERGSRVSVAYSPGIGADKWILSDLTDYSVGAWEPSYDRNLWNKSNRLDIFVQPVYQGDGERIATDSPESTLVRIIELQDRQAL